MAVKPEAKVILTENWPQDGPWWDHYLTERYAWTRGERPTVFIFDEAQMIYEDEGLWIGLLKNLRSDEYAILFASYGNVTTRFEVRGTPHYFATEERIMAKVSQLSDSSLPRKSLMI
jgi:hypothetical protein